MTKTHVWLIIPIILFTSILRVYANFERPLLSPRILAMGGACIGFAEGPLAGHWNPASIAVGEMAFAAVYSRPFGINELAESILGYEQSLGAFGNSAFAWQRFGTTNYHEDIVSMVYSRHVLSHLIIGAKLEHLSTGIYGFGSTAAFSYNAGILWQVNTNVRLGAAALRLNRPKIPGRLPRIWACGLALKTTNNMTLTADVRKSTKKKLDILVGCELRISPAFAFRAGVHNHPWQVALGWGVDYNWILIDYAWLSHPILDGTHLVSVSIIL